MKTYLSLLILVLIIISCSPSPQDNSFEPPSYSIDQFYDNIRVSGGSFNHDFSKLLVSSNESGIYNAHSLSIDGSGKEILTKSEKESVFAVTYLPTDNRFIFSADKGGDEINHLYLQESDGTARDLTPGEKEKAGFWKCPYHNGRACLELIRRMGVIINKE